MSFIFVCWHTNQLSWAINQLPPASQTDFQNLRNDRLRTFLVVHFISPPTAVSAPTKSWFFDRHLCNGHSTSKVEESRPNVIIKGETILIKNRSVRRRFHLFNPHRSLRSSPIANYRNITIIISIPIYHHHHHYNDHLHNFHHHQNNANRQSWRMCCHFCLSIRVWVASCGRQRHHHHHCHHRHTHNGGRNKSQQTKSQIIIWYFVRVLIFITVLANSLRFSSYMTQSQML